ncbi:MAG: hypothetical protein H0X33_14375 [Taibaiella sp.]|nr:hypothetical protein [Taibaiella sp.]
MKYNIVIFLVITTLLSCANEPLPMKSSNVLNYEKNRIKRTYIDDSEKVIKFYSADKIPNGSEIHYNASEKITKWLWFEKNEKYAICGIYYDSLEKFKRRKGNPFLKAEKYDKNKMAIEMVNPPNINYTFGYREWYNNKIIYQEAKSPGTTDTSSWVVIDLPKFLPNHKYIVYYYIQNDKEKIIDSSYQELAP